MADTTDADQLVTNTADMFAVHRALRREFGLMSEQLRSAGASADPRRLRAVVAHWYLLSTFLHEHHTGEDLLLWPKLLDRAPLSVEIVRTMRAQHDRISELLYDIDGLIAGLGDAPDPYTTGTAAKAIDALSSALDEHLDLEEREILPVVQTCITEAEWAELPAYAQANIPADQMMVVLGLILEDLPAPAREGMLGAMPPPVVEIWTNVGAPAYAERMKSVRGEG